MKRGIIASSCKAERIDDKGVAVTGNISKTDLNYYLLYFDEIVIPTNRIIHMALPNEDELVSLKAIQRPVAPFNSWSGHKDGYYDLFLESQLFFAKELVPQSKDIDWTLHQIGESTIISNSYSKDLNSIKVQLQDCLPVPDETIGYEKILEFKHKRKDELISLHSSIDNLYLEILNSQDSNLSSKKIIDEFKTSIENLDKVSLEAFNFLKKYELTTEININGKDIALAIAGGATFGLTSGISIPISSIIAGVLSTVNIKLSKTRSFEPAEKKLKLTYLANAKKTKLL